MNFWDKVLFLEASLPLNRWSILAMPFYATELSFILSRAVLSERLEEFESQWKLSASLAHKIEILRVIFFLNFTQSF
jgi:hypothetical protein